MKLYFLSLFVIFLNTLNCATVLHKKNDYILSSENLLNNNVTQALKNFPQK